MNRNRKFKAKKPNAGSWMSRLRGQRSGDQQQQNQQQTQQQQQQPNNQQQTQQQTQQGIDWQGFWSKPAQGQKPSLMRTPFIVDPAKIMQIARGQNFKMNIPQDVMQKILGGDANALAELLNQQSQMGYARSMHDSMGAVNAGFEQYTNSVEGYLPNMLQDHSFQQNLQNQFNQAKDPLFSGMFETVAEQIKNTNPNWTDEQIFGGVKEYFTKLGVNFDAKMQEQSGNQQQTAETDWASFGGFDTQSANAGAQSDNSGMGGGNNAAGSFSNSAAPM